MERPQEPEYNGRTLVVAAVEEELGNAAGEALGVGAVLAGIRMAQLLESRRPSSVLMMGTGGVYGDELPIGQACVARRVGYVSGVARMGLGYTPRPPEPVLCDPALLDRVNLPRVDVLTVPAITTDPLLAQRLSDGWQVEHLEAFGAAYACHLAGVPFGLVLGISNVVGPDAHLQWLTHRQDAQDAARKAVMETRV